MFRLVVSALCIAVGLQVAVVTFHEIAVALHTVPFRDYPVLTLDQLLRGILMWFVAALQIAFCIWLLYAAVGEIIYTAHRYKRH